MPVRSRRHTVPSISPERVALLNHVGAEVRSAYAAPLVSGEKFDLKAIMRRVWARIRHDRAIGYDTPLRSLLAKYLAEAWKAARAQFRPAGRPFPQGAKFVTTSGVEWHVTNEDGARRFVCLETRNGMPVGGRWMTVTEVLARAAA